MAPNESPRLGGALEDRLDGLVDRAHPVWDLFGEAADRADAGTNSRAEESLGTVRERLARVETRLVAARDDLPAGLDSSRL